MADHAKAVATIKT